jgi:NitT/TauT family transport system substrate-binding protein
MTLKKAGLDQKRRRIIAGGSAAALGSIFGPTIVRGQSRSLPDKIQMGYLPANTILLVFNQGAKIWQEQGLNVEFVRFLGGPEILNALASASIPVAEVGVGPALLSALRGAPFVFFTLGSVSGKNFPFTRIMVNKDSSIRSFADLAGKTLALHQRGTMEHLSLGAASAKYKVSTNDIKVQLVPIPNQPQVLAQKQVDAIYAVPPFDVIAEKKFSARTLIETTDFVPYLGYSALAMHKTFVSEYPEAVDRLLKAWIQFSRWVDDNTSQARAASGAFLNIPPDIAPGVRVPYYTRNALPVVPNVYHIYQMYLTAKIVEPSSGISKVINDYFIEPASRYTMKALDEVGRQPDPLVRDFLNTKLPLLDQPNSAYFAPWEKELAR